MDGEGLFGFLEALRRQWRLALLVALPLIAVAFYFAERAPAEYDGIAVVGFSPKPERDPSADVVRLTLPKYPVFLTADATVQDVALQLDVDDDELAEGLDPTVPAETSTLRIRVRHSSPSVASDAANAFALSAVFFSLQDPIVEASIVAAAVEPSEPAAPPRKLIEAAAIVLGLLAGASVALLTERGKPRVRKLSELAAISEVRVLGAIPGSRALRGISADAITDGAVGAALRSLRTSLDRESRKQPIQVLAITSSTPGEGKTTISCLLALVLSRLDARVLLVDADLVRPRVARNLGLPESEGLAAVLRGKAPLAEAVVHAGTNFDVLPTTADPEGGDLLARHLSGLLKEARNSYDIVLIDGPPLIGTDLSAIIASLAEAVIVVVRSGTTTSAIRQGLGVLNNVGVRAMGLVGNRFRDPGVGYYLPR